MRLLSRPVDPAAGWLGELALFADCSPADVRRAAAVLEEAVVPAGRALLREEALALQAFLIVSGVARVGVRGQARHTVGPGTAVGLGALMDAWRHGVTVTAVTDLRVVSITEQSLDRLLEAAPACGRSLLRAAARSRGELSGR